VEAEGVLNSWIKVVLKIFFFFFWAEF